METPRPFFSGGEIEQWGGFHEGSPKWTVGTGTFQGDFPVRQCGGLFTIEKFVNITPISLWFMVLIAILTGIYRLTYNWGAPHCMFDPIMTVSTRKKKICLVQLKEPVSMVLAIMSNVQLYLPLGFPQMGVPKNRWFIIWKTPSRNG